MRMRLVTPPSVEPVTLAEAKAHLRIDGTLDDSYIQTLITVARQHAEEVCWRAFVTQTWEVMLDAFPHSDELELPKGPVQSVESITYVDETGSSLVFDASEYTVDTFGTTGRLLLAYNSTWPGTRTIWNAVVVRYVVGTAPSAVPAPVKQAILLLVSQMYEHRTPEITGTIVTKVAFAVDALLAPYRLTEF